MWRGLIVYIMNHATKPTKKQSIHFIQNKQTRKALATIFHSVNELDANYKRQVEHLHLHTPFRRDKKSRLLKLLNILKTYSVCEKQENLGVCFLSIRNIIAVFNERYGAISERSVQYLLRDLEEWNYIQVVPTIRKSDHRQSTNIYRILKLQEAKENDSKPVEAAEVPLGEQGCHQKDNKGSDRNSGASQCQSKAKNSTENSVENGSSFTKELAPKANGNMHPKKATLSCKATCKDLKPYTKRYTKQASRLLNFVPAFFKEQTAVLNEDAQFVYELYRVAKHVGKKHYSIECSELFRDCTAAALTEFVSAMKKHHQGTRAIQNPFGYFHRLMKEITSDKLWDNLVSRMRNSETAAALSWLTD